MTNVDSGQPACRQGRAGMTKRRNLIIVSIPATFFFSYSFSFFFIARSMALSTITKVSNSLFQMFLFNFRGSVLVAVIAGVLLKCFIHIVAVNANRRMIIIKPEIFCVIESRWFPTVGSMALSTLNYSAQSVMQCICRFLVFVAASAFVLSFPQQLVLKVMRLPRRRSMALRTFCTNHNMYFIGWFLRCVTFAAFLLQVR